MGRVARQLKELRQSWNVHEKPIEPGYSSGPMHTSRPNRTPIRYYTDRSIIGSIYTRLAVDFAGTEFYHARLNKDGVPMDVIPDSLNDCLTLNPNIDQTAHALKIDWALTLFEQGEVATVLTDADLDPNQTMSYDVRSFRVAPIVGYHPRRVTVNLYDDREVDDEGEPVNGGISKQLTVLKENTMVVENPFYGIMNEPNGTLQRLIRALSLLDSIDEAAGSGKLDMLFQLPYTVRGTTRKRMAEERRQDLADQLKDDELGIGYIDVSEKVIQLNRPVDNKLLAKIEYLYNALYAQLGLTPEIMNGTADRDTINNYYNRTIEPLAVAFQLEAKRKFLTKTARTQRQSIEAYVDPLKYIPMADLAEIMDKGTRSGVMTGNDIRPKIGLRPSKDPAANKLGNPNMPADQQLGAAPPAPKEVPDEA